jgi:glutaredoxin
MKPFPHELSPLRTAHQAQQQPASRAMAQAAFSVLALLGFLHCTPALALYKFIDENGRVAYSDRPPPPGLKNLAANTSGAGSSSDDLPYVLKNSVAKYPVTLYSIADCAPCQDARKLFEQRGVPFTEKMVRTTADTDQMKKASLPFERFPVISVGSQTQNSFEAGALHGLLDAAGYPKSSALPRNYKHAIAKDMSTPPAATSDAATKVSKPASKAEQEAQTLKAQADAIAERKAKRLAERKSLDNTQTSSNLRF